MMHRITPRFSLTFFRNITPTYRAESILEISVEELRSQGINAIAFDADSTLVEHNQIVVAPAALAFLKSLQMPIIIATNRKAPLGAELATAVSALGVVHADRQSRKPRKSYFRRLQRVAGIDSKNILMVGDRLFTDIVGANRAGMHSLYVSPLGHDPLYIKATGLRYIEQCIVWIFSKKI